MMKGLRRIIFVVLAVILPMATGSGCDHETTAPDLQYNLSNVQGAGEAAFQEALREQRKQVRAQAEVPDPMKSCADDAPQACDIAHQLMAKDAYTGVFVDKLAITDRGMAVIQAIRDAYSHGLAPDAFFVQDINEHITALNTWESKEQSISHSLRESEARWLSKTLTTLSPDTSISSAEIAELLQNADGTTIFPGRAADVEKYGQYYEQAYRTAHELEGLLWASALEYARVQSLSNTNTASRDVLIERELLMRDPKDEWEYEIIGGPKRPPEWLEPWRINSLKGHEVDMEAVAERKHQLVSDRMKAFADKLRAGDAEALLASLPPDHEQYRALRKAYLRYFEVAQNGGWKTELPSENLHEGDEGDRVIALRQRLNEEGFDVGEVSNNVFDESLEKALIEVQESNQLPETGRLDSATREALATPITHRMASIALAMQQWRGSRARRDFGGYYIHVNIASYHANVRENSETIYNYRVIVGRNSYSWSKQPTETQLFSDRLERIVLNPFWHIPKSIIHNEVIPEVKENPDYIEEHNYVVEKKGSRIFIKQRPGPGNALGRIKFLFPNKFAIYMHDTPQRHLFNQVERDFSHGCVRIQNPLRLGELLIQKDHGWSKSKIEQFFNESLADKERSSVLHLHTTIPVHIDYISAAVDEHGAVEFYEDIYEIDSDAYKRKLESVEQWVKIEI